MPPLQVRRGSAPTRPSQQGRPKPERLTHPPPNPARLPRADLRGTPGGRPGGGRPRPRTQEKPPAKIPSTPRPSPRSRVSPPSPPLPADYPPLAPQMRLKTKRTTSQGYFEPRITHTDMRRGRLVFWIRASDKQHFTVRVEHRFTLFIYLFAPFNFYFCFSSCITSSCWR